MMREFHRVASKNVIVSLWVDGNYKAWRRHRLESRRSLKSNSNRFVLDRRQAEAEFKQAGFDIVTHLDFLPMYAMWRTYVLRKRT